MVDHEPKRPYEPFLMSKEDCISCSSLVLMTILGQTLKVMKTTMPPVEYQAILDNVYDSKDRIKPFTKPTIN